MDTLVVRVRYSRKYGLWWYYAGGRLPVEMAINLDVVAPLKPDVVKMARRWAKREHAKGRMTRLMIYGKDGRLQTEHTYG
jgi:putative hemolysin